MSSDALVIRAYGALLRLYPRQFREEYRDDMVLLVRDQCREESPWRVLARSAVDLAITIPKQHLEAHMRRTPSSIVPLGYLALSLAGIGLMIVGGNAVVAVVIGFAVAVIAAVLAVIAWRRSAPASEPATVTASWWRFVVAGPVLFALVILGAGVGVNAWFLGILAVLSGIVSIATGLVLGVMHLGHRIRSNPA